jgi:hypothetical protein
MGPRFFSSAGQLLVLALALAFAIAPGGVRADAQTDFEALQEARLRSGLVALTEERQNLRARYAAQEMDCLDRFLSASCLEDVRQGYARALRELDLVQESMELQIRQVHAGARQRARQEAVAQHAKAIETRRTKP